MALNSAAWPTVNRHRLDAVAENLDPNRLHSLHTLALVLVPTGEEDGIRDNNELVGKRSHGSPSEEAVQGTCERDPVPKKSSQQTRVAAGVNKV